MVEVNDILRKPELQSGGETAAQDKMKHNKTSIVAINDLISSITIFGNFFVNQFSKVQI